MYLGFEREEEKGDVFERLNFREGRGIQEGRIEDTREREGYCYLTYGMAAGVE